MYLVDMEEIYFLSLKKIAVFESMLYQDLIIKTERISRKVKENRFFTKIVKYIDSVDIKRKKEFIKKLIVFIMS